MILNNNNGYFAYMIQIAIILFYIASAMGATIIVAKGDIFHAFRAWILSKTKTNKVWVHVVVIPSNVEISEITTFGINNDLTTNVGINSSNIDELKKSIEEQYNGWNTHNFNINSVAVERTTSFDTKITIRSNTKYAISVNTPYMGSKINPFSAYETFDTIKWIAFIHDMISCPQCCGVWIGMIWYCLYRLGAMDTFLINMLCAGCVVSLFASIYWKTHDLLNNLTNKK